MSDAYGEGHPPEEGFNGKELRCPTCGKLLAEQVTPPYKIRCGRCKRLSTS